MRLFTFTIAVLISVSALAERGLVFNSNEVTKENRTGVDITSSGPIEYQSEVDIKFEISFRKGITDYGDIFSLVENDNKNTIQVSYRNPDIFVIHNKKQTKISVNTNDLNMTFNQWVKFELNINAVNNSITLTIADTTIISNINLPEGSNFSMSLGVLNKYGFFIDEVPSISLKNLEIGINGKPKHLWNFSKTTKSKIKDSLSGKELTIYNENWVINYHSKWHKQKELTFQSFPFIAYDENKEIIYFVFNNGNVGSYQLKNNVYQINKNTTNYPCLELGEQIIVDSNGFLISYSFNKSEISIYNPNTLAWSNNKLCDNDDIGNYWHHNKLIHPVSKQITTLCGYGYYTYSNLIQSFNTDINKWDTLHFTGDKITPRYLASLGKSSDPNTYYLYGGMGNPNGKQILGKEFYYDLYKINFGTQKIEKMWEYKPENQLDLLPINSLVLDQDEKSFYTLVFPALKHNSYLKLIKINTSEYNHNFIADSIPYPFTDISSYADLYYMKSENKLIALTAYSDSTGNHHATIYSINYKPENEIISETKRSKLLFLLISAALILLTVILTVIKRKTKAKSQEEIPLLVEDIISESKFVSPTTNSILLFDAFQVFDKNSKNITYRFSPTLKELFLLILLKSIRNGKGISSKKIQERLWPDKTEAKAKNNRGVNLNKLREILEDVPGTSINFENSYWKIEYGTNVFNDLDEALGLIAKNEKINETELNELIILLSRGALLNDISAEWLDKYKDSTTAIIVGYLETLITTKNTIDTKTRFAIISIIFIFDELNEVALKEKVKILAQKGKHSQALDSYNRFIKKYFELYNEEYSISFKKMSS